MHLCFFNVVPRINCSSNSALHSSEELNKASGCKNGQNIVGNAVANKLAMIPLLNNMMKRHNQELSNDTQNKLLLVSSAGKNLSLQLGETT